MGKIQPKTCEGRSNHESTGEVTPWAPTDILPVSRLQVPKEFGASSLPPGPAPVRLQLSSRIDPHAPPLRKYPCSQQKPTTMLTVEFLDLGGVREPSGSFIYG